MKTNTLLHIFGTVWVIALVTALTQPVKATGKETENEKNCSGTITSLDAKDNTAKVRGYLFNKDFILGNDCAYTLSDKAKASLTDFHPGQRVEIRYADVGGIRVVERMTEEQMQFSGTVKRMDVNNHTLTIHRRGTDKTFQVTKDCEIRGNGNKDETMDNVKWGDHVNVVYELPGNQLVARKIEVPGMVFTGSLDAIDLGDRTVSAGKKYLSDRKFRLADDCVIIANGTVDGRLSDLRLGRDYELNYESVGGINVVNRIAPAETDSKAETPTHTVQTIPPED